MRGDEMVRFYGCDRVGDMFTDQDDYPIGHAIVATIAELHLDPTVLPILCSILKTSRPEEPCTLASVASWADEHKSKWSAPMHYVNPIADHPPQLCLFPGAKGWDGAKKINILGAIRNTTDLLDHWVEQGSDLENPVASEALKFLIHFVGDMHMPFHLTARGRGGGEFYVGWAGKRVCKYLCLHSSVKHTGNIKPFRQHCTRCGMESSSTGPLKPPLVNGIDRSPPRSRDTSTVTITTR